MGLFVCLKTRSKCLLNVLVGAESSAIDMARAAFEGDQEGRICGLISPADELVPLFAPAAQMLAAQPQKFIVLRVHRGG